MYLILFFLSGICLVADNTSCGFLSFKGKHGSYSSPFLGGGHNLPVMKWSDSKSHTRFNISGKQSRFLSLSLELGLRSCVKGQKAAEWVLPAGPAKVCPRESRPPREQAPERASPREGDRPLRAGSGESRPPRKQAAATASVQGAYGGGEKKRGKA